MINVILILIYFCMQRTENEIKIDCLTRKLAEVYFISGANKECSACCVNKVAVSEERNANSKESEAIQVIKRLQEQVSALSPLLFYSLYIIIFL